MSSSAKRRSFSSWSAGERASTSTKVGLAEIATTFLLVVILSTGVLILGAARLWTQLPLLVLVSVMLLIQGIRLAAKPAEGGRRRIDVIDLTVVLFVLYTIIRWLTSPTEYFSRIEAMQVTACAVVFLTCRYGLKPRAPGMVILFVLVTLGVFEAGFGYYLHLNPDWFPFGPTERLQLHYAPRWIGTYGCPNHYGSLLVMASGAALALGCFSKLPWPVRIILFYVTGMMLIGVMYSGSRGTWLSAVAATIGLTIFGLLNRTVRWWLPVAGAAGLLFVAGTLFSFSPEVEERVADIEDIIHRGALDTYVRVELARDALRIARDHPLFGTGPGTFTFVHPRYQSATFIWKAVLTHDDYLNCLDDYGVVGLALVLVFIVAITRKWLKPLRSDSRWQDRVMVAAGFAAWSALLVHSLVDFNLHIPANALMFFSLVGLGLGRLNRDGDGPSRGTLSLAPLGRSLGLVLILLSLLYGLQAGRTALSDIAFENAYAQALTAPAEQSIRSAEEALRYDPGNAQDLVFLGDLYRYQASQQDDMESRMNLGQKALDAYHRAYLANTLDDNIQARQAMTYDVMRRYTEAFLNYQQVVAAEPYNGEYWYWLGNHYWQRNMLSKAEEAYLISIKCPHGGEASVQAEQDLRSLPEMQGVPPPPPNADPLQPEPVPAVGEHPPTTP